MWHLSLLYQPFDLISIGTKQVTIIMNFYMKFRTKNFFFKFIFNLFFHSVEKVKLHF